MSVDKKEKDSILSLFRYCDETIVVFDIGSNKGGWSDVIINERDSSTFAGKYKVHLFEPNKLLLDYTRVKYDYNKKVHFLPYAAYKEDNLHIPFYYFENENSGLSSIYHNPKWDYLPMIEGEVLTMKIGTYFRLSGEDHIDFIKIDTEGSEYDVILGCGEILNSKAVKFVQVEYSPHYQLTGRKFTDVVDYFEKYGYYPHSWDGESFVKISKEDFVEDYRLENFMFSYLPIEKHHYTQPTWNSEFIKNTQGLGKFELVLEIGCFEGLTTNYICENLLTKSGRIICVDPLEDVYLTENLSKEDIDRNESLQYFKGQYERFVKNTIGNPVELVRKKSSDAFSYINQYCFDFAYIDGDHREEAVYQDGKNVFPLIKMDGYILFDDYEWDEGTKMGIDRFINEYSIHKRIRVLIKDYQVLIQKIAA